MSCNSPKGQPEPRGATPEGKSFPAKIAQLNLETVQRTEEASGTFLPKDEVKVSAEIKGKIKEIHVEEEDRVKKGGLLVKIDDRRYVLTAKM